MAAWSHWSTTPITDVRNVPQASADFKPKGLWISDESDEQSWSTWCTGEGFCNLSKMVRHNVTISPDADLLVLSTPEELREFTADLGVMFTGRSVFIDWPALAGEYQGILITPYIWECRLEFTWYYGWDCASGCIWDSAAIHRIEVA